jgi:DNA polymerase-3 subunit delta'
VKEKDEVEEGDRFPGAPRPRERTELIGHADAEAAVLAAWAQGRLPHAWLIGGLEGIGKATLAYRIARFVLCNPKPDARSLAVTADHPVSRQVAALAHPDLLVLRRVAEEGKKLPSEIPVAQARRTVGFFGSTAAYGGYRVCVVDSIDEMNRFGANALLKVLEEPPPRSLLLIVAHTPGRVLATIRSRCQRLMLRPLSVADVARTLQSLAPAMEDLPEAQIPQAAEASGGSVRHALALLMGEGLEVRNLTKEALARLPATDGVALHTLGDRMAAGDEGLAIFAETVEDWLAAAARGPAEPERLARFAETWEKVRRAAAEAEVFRLDRKPLVFQVFAMLAEATRR